MCVAFNALLETNKKIQMSLEMTAAPMGDPYNERRLMFNLVEDRG